MVSRRFPTRRVRPAHQYKVVHGMHPTELMESTSLHHGGNCSSIGGSDLPHRNRFGRDGVLKLTSLSRLEFHSRFVNEVVQLSSPGVGLNLFVPELMVKFEKPRPKLRQVF